MEKYNFYITGSETSLKLEKKLLDEKFIERKNIGQKDVNEVSLNELTSNENSVYVYINSIIIKVCDNIKRQTGQLMHNLVHD